MKEGQSQIKLMNKRIKNRGAHQVKMLHPVNNPHLVLKVLRLIGHLRFLVQTGSKGKEANHLAIMINTHGGDCFS